MKKHLLLFVFAFAALAVQAQNGNPYSIVAHDMGEYIFNIDNVMRQQDGDMLINLFVGVVPDQVPVSVGNIFYKMSPSTLTFTDSLLVEDPDAPYYLFASNPIGEGNIRANFEYAEDCDSTFLRICHFPDNDLYINHDEDIVVPVCEGYAWSEYDNHLVDCRGDLIMQYYKERPEGGCDVHIARFGPDGTLKYQTLFSENQNIVIPKMRALKELPLQYYQWRSFNEENLAIYVIDSLFHKNTVILNKILNEEIIMEDSSFVREYLNFNYDTEVIPDGNDVILSARYTIDTNNWYGTSEKGVAVVKYDLRTMQRKGLVEFNDYPGYTNDGLCLGLKKMSDGTVYFLYKEKGYPDESIVIVKMDTDLSVEWKRYFKTDNIIISTSLSFPILFEGREEDNGIAWMGAGLKAGTEKVDIEKADLIYFFLHHDGTADINDSNIEVRPYTYYPNPTLDQLHLQYSPDVQPMQIELYDMQGRLARTQSQDMESLNLQGLSAGQYVMKVILVDGKVYSDKVVKGME